MTKEELIKEVVTEFKQLKGHVLVVDDEEPLRNILTMILEMFGLTVEQAENGEVALSKIKSNKYDVVITDIKMPKMSGDQLICRISSIEGHLISSIEYHPISTIGYRPISLIGYH